MRRAEGEARPPRAPLVPCSGLPIGDHALSPRRVGRGAQPERWAIGSSGGFVRASPIHSLRPDFPLESRSSHVCSLAMSVSGLGPSLSAMPGGVVLDEFVIPRIMLIDLRSPAPPVARPRTHSWISYSKHALRKMHSRRVDNNTTRYNAYVTASL